MIVADYGLGNDPNRRIVIVDPAAGTVTFDRCHHPRGFLAWGPDLEYTCPLADLRGVCWNQVRGVGRVLEVVTPAGRARIPESANGFEAARRALIDGMPPGARPRRSSPPCSSSSPAGSSGSSGTGGGLIGTSRRGCSSAS